MRVTVSLVASWLFLLLLGGMGFAGQELGPWKVGERLDAFQITDVKRHPEYIRVRLHSPEAETRIELIPAKKGGRVCTPFVCLQAAPRKTLPPGLLEAARRHQEAYERAHGEPQWFEIIRHRPEQRRPDVVGGPLEARAKRFWGLAVGTFGAMVASLLFLGALRRYTDAGVWPMRLSRLAMWGLTLYPAFLLVLIVMAFAGQILRVAAILPDEAIRQLETTLATKLGPHFDIRDEGDRLCFDVSGTPRCLAETPGPRILVFGGSSVVLPVYERAFPALLEGKLVSRGYPDAQVVNLGVPGYDSTAILARLRASLPRFGPDLVIFYMGHNDYTAVYRSPVITDVRMIAPSPTLSALAWLAFRWGDYRAEGLAWQPEISQFGPFLQARAEPALIQAAQDFGLLRLPSVSERLNALALAHFSRNLETMLDLCSEFGAPVLLVAPISNLEAPVYGEEAADHARHRQALRIPDYAPRLAALRAAKDRDVFSLDVRAKTDLLNHLRGIDRPGVWLLDLERSLEQEKFSFGFNDFRDYVHFLQGTHARVATKLAAYLEQNTPIFTESHKD